LQKAEQDWWEFPPIDLQPLLLENPKIRVFAQDPTGGVTLMRPNHLQPPFNNPAFRRAFFYAIDQVEFMQAIVGTDPAMYHTPEGIFCPGTPMATEVGLEPLTGKRDYKRAAEMLKQAGYSGEKILLMAGSDIFEMKTTGEVMADTMKRVGLNVEYFAADGASLFPKRNNRGPVDQGGWSAFITGFSGSNQLNPPVHLPVRGNGDQANSWPGWCVSPELERLRNAWFDAPDLAGQQEICRRMQLQAMQDVPYYPLGQFAERTAHRVEITGLLNGFSTFWNVRPA
jgi:peptide/nickel transport system substrate-binding protein